MLHKWTKLITNNFGLKILAIIFAVVLWLVVVNVEDPETTKVFTVPVSIENADYLTKMGKTYEVLNDSDQISFTVSGQRSVIEELSESDFSAVANMENIDESMSIVPITVTASRYDKQIEITKRSSYLEINVENLITKKFPISVIVEGTPAEYCYVSDTEISPQKVTVTGPESVVQKIASAQVTVNVDNAEETLVTNSKIVLLDERGDVVSQNRLSLNRTKAAVDVIIMMGKEVKLNFVTSGEPAEGFRYKEITSDVTKVRLIGAPEVLDSIDTLDIKAPQLNLDGVRSDFEVTVNLSNYLPEGVSLAEGEPSAAKVAVTVEGQETRIFQMPVANIKVQNLPGNLQLQYNGGTVEVSIKGYAEELDKIAAESLEGTLDASGLTVGTQTAVVKLLGEYSVAAEVNISVTISEKDTSSSTGTVVIPGNPDEGGNEENVDSGENVSESEEIL